MFLRFLKLFFVIVTTLSLGTWAFLHGFNAWRAGQVAVWRKGREPFVATVDGAFPITFATEVWGFALAIIGAVVAFFLYLGFRVHTQ
jgi:hypothetical protein